MSELGSRLRMAREEKSLTLDELQEITRIQKRYLVAIEEGNYDIMPGKFYARAFIKQYAEAVDLEPELLFEEYKNEIPQAHDNLPEQLSRAQKRRAVSPRNSKILELFPKILTAVFVVAILIIAWFLITKYWNFGDKQGIDENNQSSVNIKQSDEIVPDSSADENKTANDNKETDETDESDEGTELKQKIEVESVTGNTTTYSISNIDTFELTVKATSPGETWIEVTNNNGKVFTKQMLKDGESQTYDFTNETEAYIRTGKSIDTEIFINDEKLTYELDPQQNIVQNIIIQNNIE